MGDGSYQFANPVSCHQVAVHPGIKLEVVWEQYRASPAAAEGITCQECHMGKVPGEADAVLIAATEAMAAPEFNLQGIQATTNPVAVWLIAWAVLHWRWSGRQVAEGRIYMFTLAAVALGLLATFPPFWAIL